MNVVSSAHEIKTETSDKNVRILFQGKLIAETRRAVILSETGLPSVYYIPREDAKMQFFARSTHMTRCPYKGIANYFDLTVDGVRSVNAVWTYEDPIAAAKAITGHLAFYPDRVVMEY
jgi:uncharacterized protein (DUF427 family)